MGGSWEPKFPSLSIPRGNVEWEPQLNRTVSAWTTNYTGQWTRYFNPHNFTRAGFYQSSPNASWYAYSYATYCAYPISGTYCFLNRLLFYGELCFSLLTLALGFEWLSLIGIAAALNYSGAAACHALVLTLTPAALPGDLDTSALASILMASVLFAYPLLHWSRTLRHKKHVDSRLVIAAWTFLVCFALMSLVRPTSGLSAPQTYVPIEVNNECIFSESLEPEIWQHDRINPLVPVFSMEEWHRCSITAHLPCISSLDTPFRRGEKLALWPTRKSFNWTVSTYYNLGMLYKAYALATCIATIGAVFHGKWSTYYVRARIYEYVRGHHRRLWRTMVAFLVASSYHAVHFTIGITSIPIVISHLTIQETLLRTVPSSELPNHVGQWGPWIGGALLLASAILIKDPNPRIVRALFAWTITAPLRCLWPGRFKKRSRPSIGCRIDFHKHLKDLLESSKMFLVAEYQSTSRWILHPDRESRRCIREESLAVRFSTLSHFRQRHSL